MRREDYHHRYGYVLVPIHHHIIKLRANEKTGISHAYGGVLAALSVDYSLTKIDEDRWAEREVVRAVYEHESVTLADVKQKVPAPY